MKKTMFGPILLAAGIGVAWWAYKAINDSPGSRRLISGFLVDRLTSDEIIKLGLEGQGFTQLGPIMVSGDEWKVYAKPPSPPPDLPVNLNYMGFPAFAITSVE